MLNVLFITNKVFLDTTQQEGGVRLCTNDYIKLIECKFKVILYKLDFNKHVWYRIKAKIGIDVFEEYSLKKIANPLIVEIRKKNIKYVFINLANASAISGVIKKEFGNSVKVILCSHGFEAGDILHQSVRFKKHSFWIKRLTSSWRLGKILQKELQFRMKYFDLILTVSEIEKSIEYWLGAQKVFFVPRVFKPDFLNRKPEVGKIGFIGDISHYPNYYGLYLICNEIKNSGQQNNIKLIVVGKQCINLENLVKDFTFINATGYLEGDALIAEVSTWMYFLNPVFYYSKGVSTKLAKGMNWGLPIISTTAGNRGYIFKSGAVITHDTPKSIIEHVVKSMKNPVLIEEEAKLIKSAVESFTDYCEVMQNLYPMLIEL